MNHFLGAQIHISWLIAWGSVGLLAGIALAAIVSWPIHASQSLSIATIFMVIAVLRRTHTAVILVICAGMLCGLSRGGAEQQALVAYEPFYGKQVVLKGTVSEDVSLGDKGDTRMQLVAVHIDDQYLPGKVWASTASSLAIKRSDIVTISGVLSEGFGNTPASMFRAEVAAVERPQNADIARDVRDWFADSVRVAIPEPEASLGIGYLVGQRSALPEELDAQLVLLGLTHVVVASGYNLTILVRFTRRSLAKRSKYLATMAASFMIAGFMLITGFSPSMSRAALVTGLSLLAWYFGRRIHPLVVLPFAAAVTAIINPAYVWGDIGWYLSFTAFAGIMILAPLLKRVVFGERQPRTIVQVLLETFSAQLATLPIIIFVFGQYSSLALPANALILPFVPLAMLLTFIAGVAGVMMPALAPIMGLPATALLRYMTTVVDKMAAIPGASNELTFSISHLVISYLVLVGVCVLLWRKTRYSFRSENIID